jgi:hypothetical protein
MKINFLQVILLFTIVSSQCQTIDAKKSFTKIIVDTLISDKISIRAITIDKNKVYYAADKNRFEISIWFLKINSKEK